MVSNLCRRLKNISDQNDISTSAIVIRSSPESPVNRDSIVFLQQGKGNTNQSCLGKSSQKSSHLKNPRWTSYLPLHQLLQRLRRAVCRSCQLFCLFQINISKTAIHSMTMKSWLKRQTAPPQ